jgi:ABC-type glycerol-3-phosphate transport system permease component
MLPQQTVLIPLYDMLRWLHLFDTRIGLIVVHGVYGMPSQILILRGFMTTIPRDIEKAAQIEGATDFQIFTKGSCRWRSRESSSGTR